MSRLKNYYNKLLLEKVSKREIDDALKNKNITIGVEWEFILDDYSDYLSSASENFDDAYQEWRDFNDATDKAIGQYNDFWDEMSKERMAIEDMEGERDDLDTEDIEEEISDLEVDVKHPDDPENKDEIEATQLKLAKLKVKLNTIEKEIEYLDDSITQRQDELVSREDNYYDEIDWPEMGSDYIEYMEYHHGDTIEIDPFAIVVGDDNMPSEPYSDENRGDDAIKESMEDSGMLDDAPFKYYEFTSDKQRANDTHWAIEGDGSLSDGGVEVKSPPMSLPDFMKIFPDVLEWIERYGSTDSSTGMHVHMGFKGIKDLEDKINPLKMMMFMDEGYIWNSFEDRMDNNYVKSIKRKFETDSDVKKDIKNIFDLKKLKKKLSTAHSDAINFSNISEGHIEYRYLGGNNYEHKEAELTASIGHFAHNMALGLDPEYKKREYKLKMQRVFNKLELWTLRYQKSIVDRTLSSDNKKHGDIASNDLISLRKLQKELNKGVGVLGKIYKMDKKTEHLIHGNRRFKDSIIDDLKKSFRYFVKSSKDAIAWT